MHVPSVEEQPGRPVAGQVLGAQDLGEPAEPPAAPQVELEQPVPGGVEALGAEQVVLGLRVQVRYAELVDQHLDGCRQPG